MTFNILSEVANLQQGILSIVYLNIVIHCIDENLRFCIDV